MGKSPEVFVNIYVHIWGGAFPKDMTNRKAAGFDIYKFLMRDAGLIWCGSECRAIRGDPVIWYLGLGDGYGTLQYESRVWVWDNGGASFDIVYEFITRLSVNGVINSDQYQALRETINEGRTIPSMLKIYKHLKNKQAINRLDTASYSDRQDLAA